MRERTSTRHILTREMAVLFTPPSRWTAASALLLLLLVVAAVAVLLPGARAWQYCEDDDINGIYGHCWESIQRKGPRVPPSMLCCSFIGDALKMPCVCKYLVTREVEKTISIPRLAMAARCCGAPLDPGTRCGTRYTTPVTAELGDQCSPLRTTKG